MSYLSPKLEASPHRFTHLTASKYQKPFETRTPRKLECHSRLNSQTTYMLIMLNKFVVSRLIRGVSLACIISLMPFGLQAAAVFTFEPPAYTGSPAGTTIAGQNGWTTPTGNAFVYTYAGNAPGFAADPGGGTQFLGASSSNPAPGPSSTPPASRARQPLDLSAGTLWSMTFDIAALSDGVTDNAGIFN